MGRRPNSVIATHFVRGQKHRETTNRYSQTCTHCNQLFPTGRPETLFSHLANCPGLTKEEQAEVVGQIYNTSSTGNVTPSTLSSGHQQHHVHQEDFDITGLNVLAGAAENAEDLAIDPQITTTTEAEMLRYYDSRKQPSSVTPAVLLISLEYGGTYAHANPSTNAWAYPFTGTHESSAPYPELPPVSSDSPTFSVANLPGTQWSFAPTITPPTSYVTHPTHDVPISFADQDHDQIEDDNGLASDSNHMVSYNAKTRKSKAPYTESKRARVAEMRQVGACIRCSRLRKTCEPSRPCSACRGTASKTWVGGCTSLNRGQEFTFWYEVYLRDAYASYVKSSTGTCPSRYDNQCCLDLALFGATGPKLHFDLTKAHANRGVEDDRTLEVRDSTNCYIICPEESVVEKLLQHAVEHQELIVDSIEIPALHSTVRIAQGMSLSNPPNPGNQVWGSGKQTDDKIDCIFHLWLMISLLANGEVAQKMAISRQDGQNIDSRHLERSRTAIAYQIHAALETFMQGSQDDMRRFDANILHQSYKYLFNLVIGMILILDSVEKYCCFMNSINLSSVDLDAMIEQAETLADKYAYCVQNIQMMPHVSFDEDGVMFALQGSGRVDHEMQRVWIRDMSISRTDLDICLGQEDGEEWRVPRGRLWAKLFTRANAE